jgi:outer membrane protein TolC
VTGLINSKTILAFLCGLVVAVVFACPVSAQDTTPKINSTSEAAPVIASFASSPVVPDDKPPVAAVENAPAAPVDNSPAASFDKPPVAPGDKPMPIDLPSALRLGHADALDIAIASQQWRAAVAQLQGAWALWLPNVESGGEYVYHTGPIQGVTGTTTSADRSSLYAGFAPLVQLALTDAIFTPLAARQVVRAQRANIETQTNDTLRSVALVYFDAEEARAELGAVQDVLAKVRALVAKVDSLAPELIPNVEKARVRAQQSNVEQIAETARNRWRVASAELVRILRLEPTLVIEPVDPPSMQITLISPDTPAEQLIPIAIERRPELTFADAQVEAANQRLHQEQWRPFLPTFYLQGNGTDKPDSLMVGTYGAGPNGSLSPFGSRVDLDAQLIWELRGLGVGNLALVREREANLDTTVLQRSLSRELVSREVAQYHADVVAAAARIRQAERELQQATVSANENLAGVGAIKRVGGNINILVIRPQEAVSAIQQLASAYFDYFGAIADYNRAQFQLYRAVGNPADLVYRGENAGGNSSPLPPPPAPSVAH